MNLKSLISKCFWLVALLFIFVCYDSGRASTHGFGVDPAVASAGQTDMAVNAGSSIRNDVPTTNAPSASREEMLLPKLVAAASFVGPVPQAGPQSSMMFLGMAGMMMVMIRAGRTLRQGRSMSFKK